MVSNWTWTLSTNIFLTFFPEMKTASRRPSPSRAARRRESDAGQPQRRSLPLALALALVVIGCLAYSNSFSVPFLFDDLDAIPENPTLRGFPEVLSPPVETTVYGRPVLNVSFALNYALSGVRVWSYHAANLLIHLAAGLALFGIVRRTLLTPRLAETFGQAAAPLAAVAAGLWLVHPVQTESVTYIVQRAEALVGLFYFLTLYCAIRAAGADDGTTAGSHAGTGAGDRLWPVLAVVCCALGMGTKEVMATAPFLVLLHDRTFLSGSFALALRRRRGLYGGLFATLVIVLALAAKGRPGSAGFGEGMAWHEYARTQPGVILHYLRLSLLPFPLVFDYLWPVARGAGVLVPLLVLLIPAGATLWLLWRNSPAGFAGAWFFAILAPSSSVIPIVTEVAAEHRLYLPLAAVCALAVAGGYAALRPKGLHRMVLPASGVVIVLFALGTFLRNRDYRTPVAIWSDTVEKRPANVRAHYNLAKALEEEGRLEEAIRHYSEKVLPLKPDYAEARVSLGLALARTGRLDDAMTHYEAALKARPDLAEAHNNMGLVLARQGRIGEALDRYAEAVRLKPAYAEAWYNMANALAEAGRAEEAIARYREAIRLKPDFPAAHVNLAITLQETGRDGEAKAHYAEAIRHRPDYATAHANLGMLLARRGETERARRHLETALRHDPHMIPARQALEQLSQAR